jgi:two-component system, OmpR family, copper resistance phosphate regulon response regulator CusR
MDIKRVRDGEKRAKKFRGHLKDRNRAGIGTARPQTFTYHAAMRILLVEDDPGVRRFVVKGLREQAYAVDIAATGEDALYQADINEYDLIILDVMIPPPDGFEVCRRLRKSGKQMPILMLTARDAVEDRVSGLDRGADDYLTKPFEFRELLARLRALLRRSTELHPPRLSVGELVLDTAAQNATLGGDAISLTHKEYALLEYLVRNAGRVVSRAEIAEHVWDESFDPFSNLIEVYINRLRRKIDPDGRLGLLQTRRGAGYILKSDEASEGGARTQPAGAQGKTNVSDRKKHA